MRKFNKILVTGGAGFIGSHLIHHFTSKYPETDIVNLDKLTYAGNLENLIACQDAPNYSFVKGDIEDLLFLKKLFTENKFDAVVHLAAESHVDRSIKDPLAFIHTNVLGTANMLLASREAYDRGELKVFYHVSTDEVYGSLGDEGLFHEDTSYDPRSPYSASKASSDHFVRAYNHTYGLPILISNCSNNYGPFQFPEKLIPLMINNIKLNKDLPVYGDGTNVRDWLWVGDHVSAIDAILSEGKMGDTYNVGGNNEMQNIELVQLLCDVMDEELSREPGSSRKLIRFVTDRPGHDRRYAIDSSKIMSELGWEPSVKPYDGFKKTIKWYLENQEWLQNVTSGAYQDYYKKMYTSSVE